MIEISDCYEKISCADCQYGAHVFDGKNFSIYVNNWLDVDGEIRDLFSKKNEQGYVGNCNLVFRDVARCEIRTKYYSDDDNGRVIWTPAQNISYKSDEAHLALKDFVIGGSLKGFRSSVEIFISATKCDLWIWQADEPAKE